MTQLITKVKFLVSFRSCYRMCQREGKSRNSAHAGKAQLAFCYCMVFTESRSAKMNHPKRDLFLICFGKECRQRIAELPCCNYSICATLCPCFCLVHGPLNEHWSVLVKSIGLAPSLLCVCVCGHCQKRPKQRIVVKIKQTLKGNSFQTRTNCNLRLHPYKLEIWILFAFAMCIQIHFPVWRFVWRNTASWCVAFGEKDNTKFPISTVVHRLCSWLNWCTQPNRCTQDFNWCTQDFNWCTQDFNCCTQDFQLVYTGFSTGVHRISTNHKQPCEIPHGI